MKKKAHEFRQVWAHLPAFLILLACVFWIRDVSLEEPWQEAGFRNYSFGLLILTAFVASKLLRMARLPFITGCILAGLFVGPHCLGWFSREMVLEMRLVDDLALSFIGLSAGGALQLTTVRERAASIAANVILQFGCVFMIVFLFILSAARFFPFFTDLSVYQTLSLAILAGVLSTARSPSSAIAVISETRASGVFTETILGVTMAMDVLVIVGFTIALSIVKSLMGVSQPGSPLVLGILSEVFFSVGLGVLLGKGICVYADRGGENLSVFLLLFAFGVSKASAAIDHFLESLVSASIHLEPLLICMSAGFFVGNFARTGHRFMEALDRFSLPIYLVFFALAGASLNPHALWLTWPLALSLFLARALGMLAGTRWAGKIARDSDLHSRWAFMAYFTQAGVAIGLSQMLCKQFPEMGRILNTLILAVILLNQILGPVALKIALEKTGEAGAKRRSRPAP